MSDDAYEKFALESRERLLASRDRARECNEKLEADNKALTAQVERLREALVEAYNEQLNTSMSEGYTKTQDTDILWSHGFRSDGEWLVRMCGLDDKKGWHDFDDLRSRIPEAANRMVDAALAETASDGEGV